MSQVACHAALFRTDRSLANLLIYLFLIKAASFPKKAATFLVVRRTADMQRCASEQRSIRAYDIGLCRAAPAIRSVAQMLNCISSARSQRATPTLEASIGLAPIAIALDSPHLLKNDEASPER